MARQTRVYGKVAGNSGELEDPAKCIEEVWPANEHFGLIGRQCRRKRGHGPGGLYCKHHAKELT